MLELQDDDAERDEAADDDDEGGGAAGYGEYVAGVSVLSAAGAVVVALALLLWKLRRIPKDGRRGSGLPLDADSAEESLSVNIERERGRTEYQGRTKIVKSVVRGRVYVCVGVNVVRGRPQVIELDRQAVSRPKLQ
jgi:hypothetical protein